MREGGQQEFHAACITPRVAESVAHIAAPDPLRARRQADLVLSVEAHHGTGGVRAVTAVVVGLGAPIPGIVPVIVVVGRTSIPAQVGTLQCRVVPGHARIGTAHDHALACDAQVPYPVGAHLLHVPLYPLRPADVHVRDFGGIGDAAHARLELHRGHARLIGKRVPQAGPALYLDHVDQVVGPVRYGPLVEFGP